eukprot:357718-Chlamydomonas_euryale.AAC.5
MDVWMDDLLTPSVISWIGLVNNLLPPALTKSLVPAYLHPSPQMRQALNTSNPLPRSTTT